MLGRQPSPVMLIQGTCGLGSSSMIGGGGGCSGAQRVDRGQYSAVAGLGRFQRCYTSLKVFQRSHRMSLTSIRGSALRRFQGV